MLIECVEGPVILLNFPRATQQKPLLRRISRAVLRFQFSTVIFVRRGGDKGRKGPRCSQAHAAMSSQGASRNALAFGVSALLAGCGGASQDLPNGALGTQPSTSASKAQVGMWVDDGSQIFGQDSKGTKTITVIVVSKNGCGAPWGMKVDHSKNLWVACEFYGSESFGAVQEYAPGSDKPVATYTESFDCGKGCTFMSNGLDVAFDSSGHVFEANTYSAFCTPSCSGNVYPVLWWNASSPSSPPTGIADPYLTRGYYIDVDNLGNLYLSGLGTVGSKSGPLIDEISNPTSSSPTITHLIFASSGSINPNAIYVSNHGKVLNVIDGNVREVSQYALPWVPSESPFNVLGPTRKNYFGAGYPIDGGFNLGDKMMAIGDEGGWIDIGRVKNNHWSVASNYNFEYHGLVDAVYVPSDK